MPCTDPQPADDCLVDCSDLRATSNRVCAGTWVCPARAPRTVSACLAMKDAGAPDTQNDAPNDVPNDAPNDVLDAPNDALNDE